MDVDGLKQQPVDEASGPALEFDLGEPEVTPPVIKRRVHDDDEGDYEVGVFAQIKNAWQWPPFWVGVGVSTVFLFFIWMAFFPSSRRGEVVKLQLNLESAKSENADLKIRAGERDAIENLKKQALNEVKDAANKVVQDRKILDQDRQTFEKARQEFSKKVIPKPEPPKKEEKVEALLKEVEEQCVKGFVVFLNKLLEAKAQQPKTSKEKAEVKPMVGKPNFESGPFFKGSADPVLIKTTSATRAKQLTETFERWLAAKENALVARSKKTWWVHKWTNHGDQKITNWKMEYIPPTDTKKMAGFQEALVKISAMLEADRGAFENLLKLDETIFEAQLAKLLAKVGR